MDLKQAAQQAIVAEQAAAESAAAKERRSTQRSIEKWQRGESDGDLIRLELTAEQQALIDEFAAAVPAGCWKTDRRRYRHSDGTVRISFDHGNISKPFEKESKMAKDYFRLSDPKHAKRSEKKQKALEAKLISGFQREGPQRCVCIRRYSYNGFYDGWIFIFEDGACFGYYTLTSDFSSEKHYSIYEPENLRNVLLEELTKLLKPA